MFIFNKLKTFPKGGIHPPEVKISAEKPIERLPLPANVKIPISQHIGVPAVPVVERGEFVKTGQIIAKTGGFVSANIHATATGKIAKISDEMDISGYRRMTVMIRVDKEEQWADGIDTTDELRTEISLTREQILEKILEGGIVGMGGATFPSHIKLNVPRGKKADVLIINGAECEPYLTSDHQLMLEKSEELMVGVQILMKALDVKKAIIGIENNKKDAITFYDTFITLLTKILEETAGVKHNKSKHRKAVLWWTKECSQIIKERNDTKKRLLKHWSQDNLNKYRNKKAQAQRCLRQTKNNFWQTFCASINRSTSVSAMWKFIKDSNGVSSTKNKITPTLHVGENLITEDNDKANEFGKYYQSIGAENKENKTKDPKRLFEELICDDDSLDLAINEPFRQNELEKVLQCKKSSAPGDDNIGYQVYQNLPQTKQKLLLELYNLIWETDDFPAPCKHSILIPILKPGKDPHQMTSYRPIALTPCFTKIMESMVNNRLQYFAEKHDILKHFQLGFRKGRGTIDNIVILENDILKHLETGVKSLAVFVDLEKAYDLLRIINVGDQFVAVHDKKGFHGRMTNPLVAVHERMIHDQRKTQRRRFGLDGRIEFVTAERHLRLRDGGFNTAQVAHAGRTARLLDDATMKIENLSQREIAHQLSRL